MSIEDGYNTSMTVNRVTVGQDAVGGATETPAPIGTYKCRIRLLTEQERVVSGREGTVGTHRIYTSAGAVVRAADNIVIGTTTYDVFRINPTQGLQNVHHQEIDVTLRA